MREARKSGITKKTKIIIIVASITLLVAAGIVFVLVKFFNTGNPEETLNKYVSHIVNKEYSLMYQMIDAEKSAGISEEDFIKRNSAIYEGIQMSDMNVEIISSDKNKMQVTYNTSFNTSAGNISFENTANFTSKGGECKLIWTDALIFPNLTSSDKVRVSSTEAKRGEILDRNGVVLAGQGKAASVGIVPGKFKKETIEQVAELLEIQPDNISNALSAEWIKETSFVSIKTLPSIENSNNENAKEADRQKKLLDISGIMISEINVREYPLGQAAAHLVGYTQSVTAEDLEKYPTEGYTAESVIGRTGVEALYEKELKGENGYKIYIMDSQNNEKEVLANKPVKDGETIKLTIDASLQSEIYKTFNEEKSASVAINQYTGEVLALVSTPAYDNNDFILGFTDKEWEQLNNDKSNPLYNRFRQSWSPGSTFKPITAALGLDTNSIDPSEDYTNNGLSWQKDNSWGEYFITTLNSYTPANLSNAIMCSDNIYFAKAALKIGYENFQSGLEKLGFNTDIPFDISMSKSQYSNTDKIETEIQLADSGYGQAQVLVNPLHMACLYSSFCNNGNVIKPYLIYKELPTAEYWIPDAISSDAANTVLEAMKQVVNNPNGTAYAAKRDDIVLAGKTGTAEIKASVEDTSGTELGWFGVFTTNSDISNPVMLISMVEDVKEKGGSGYVVIKDTQVLQNWFAK